MSAPLFPNLIPSGTDPLWFIVDKPCDDENELSELEEEYQKWIIDHELIVHQQLQTAREISLDPAETRFSQLFCGHVARIEGIAKKGENVIPIGKTAAENFDEEDDDEEDEGDDDDESDTNDDELETDMIDDRDSPDEVDMEANGLALT